MAHIVRAATGRGTPRPSRSAPSSADASEERRPRPARRVGVAERRLGELLVEADRRVGIPRRLEREPVGLGLVAARDRVLDGKRREEDEERREQPERHERRVAQPSAPLRHRARRAASPGTARSANHARPFQRWLRATWASSCAASDEQLVAGEAPVEHRVVEDDALRRPEPRDVRVRGRRAPARVRDLDAVDRDALLLGERADLGGERAVRQRLEAVEERLEDERLDDDEEHAPARRAPAPPASHQRRPRRRASQTAPATAIETRTARTPSAIARVAEPVRVALLREPVAPRPPVRRRPRAGSVASQTADDRDEPERHADSDVPAEPRTEPGGERPRAPDERDQHAELDERCRRRGARGSRRARGRRARGTPRRSSPPRRAPEGRGRPARASARSSTARAHPRSGEDDGRPRPSLACACRARLRRLRHPREPPRVRRGPRGDLGRGAGRGLVPRRPRRLRAAPERVRRPGARAGRPLPRRKPRPRRPRDDSARRLPRGRGRERALDRGEPRRRGARVSRRPRAGGRPRRASGSSTRARATPSGST